MEVVVFYYRYVVLCIGLFGCFKYIIIAVNICGGEWGFFFCVILGNRLKYFLFLFFYSKIGEKKFFLYYFGGLRVNFVKFLL